METPNSLVTESQETKGMFSPYWRAFKKIIFGNDRPSLWIRLFVYFGMFVATIFGLWSLISFSILKNPHYLKQHKKVDVLAIVELRGRELQMEGELFINNLEKFHFLSMCSWFLVFIALILVWRKKKYAIHLLLGSFIFYCVAMFWLLGTQYFVEDTTSFDKFFLIALLICSLVHYILREQKQLKNTSIVDEELQDEEKTEIH